MVGGGHEGVDVGRGVAEEGVGFDLLGAFLEVGEAGVDDVQDGGEAGGHCRQQVLYRRRGEVC